MAWMRQRHYYLGLYPQICSVALMVATAVSGLIANEVPAAMQRWLYVLKASGTMKPLQPLQLAGIDLNSTVDSRCGGACRLAG